MEDRLRQLTKNTINFIIYNRPLHEKLDEITTCLVKTNNNCKQSDYCILSDGDICKLLIPKINLINNSDNEVEYFGKMADELVRYSRVRHFIFEPQAFLSFSSIKYNLNNNEIIVIQSLLNADYFANITIAADTKYVDKTTYDTVEPLISQSYAPIISNIIEEQPIIIKPKKKIVLKTGPSIAEPSIAQPSIAQPSIAQPSIAQPSIAQPSIAGPSIAQPSIAQPSIAEPSIAQPSIAQLSIAQPSIAQPSIAQPSIAETSIAEPSIAEPYANILLLNHLLLNHLLLNHLLLNHLLLDHLLLNHLLLNHLLLDHLLLNHLLLNHLLLNHLLLNHLLLNHLLLNHLLLNHLLLNHLLLNHLLLNHHNR